MNAPIIAAFTAVIITAGNGNACAVTANIYSNIIYLLGNCSAIQRMGAAGKTLGSFIGCGFIVLIIITVGFNRILRCNNGNAKAVKL